METLMDLDRWLFLVLNHLTHLHAVDLFAQFLSGIGMAGIIWFILGIILFLREEKKHHWFFAPLVLTGILSYLLTEVIFKNLIARPRPSEAIGAIIIGAPSTDFSFPSGHATIAFAMAVVLSKIESRWKWLFYFLAVAISFSRIYLGKHFPLDIIAGAVLGWLIGNLALFISQKIKPYF